MIQAIAHPTDFSTESDVAFEHALGLPVVFTCRLDLLHVRSPKDQNEAPSFPRVRETLARWGLLSPAAPVDHIISQLGVKVRKIEVRDTDATAGVVNFLLSHRPDLIVLATHGPAGMTRWLLGSISEGVARKTHSPTLFFGPKAQAFTDALSGKLRLK